MGIQLRMVGGLIKLLAVGGRECRGNLCPSTNAARVPAHMGTMMPVHSPCRCFYDTTISLFAAFLHVSNFTETGEGGRAAS